MIGLFFYAIVILWLCFAVWLAKKILIWLNFNKWKSTLKVVLTAFIFFLPVIDEIIAYPQMQALCSNLQSLHLADGMDEKKAYGRTVYYSDISKPINIFPSSVHIDYYESGYFDATSHEKILIYQGYTPKKAFLSIPNGSSGGKMPAILRGCSGMKSNADGYAIEKYDKNGLPTRFKHLNLTKISTP